MLITAGIILLLAILLAPILLIRFRKKWVAAFNMAVTNRITRGLNECNGDVTTVADPHTRQSCHYRAIECSGCPSTDT